MMLYGVNTISMRGKIMYKLNLYLNDSQYEKLCILAEEAGEEPEEYINERAYLMLLIKWCKYKSIKLEELLNDPNIDWKD